MLFSFVSAFTLPRRDDRMAGIMYKSLSNPLEAAGNSKIYYTVGSPVLVNQVNIYYLYYGNFTASQKDILEDFARNVGESDWYKTTTQYYYQETEDGPKTYVSNQVQLAGTYQDNYSLGNELYGDDLPDLIQKHINAKRLPEDTNGVYFVLTAGDVAEQARDDLACGDDPTLGCLSFCNDYCGYHVSTDLRSGKRVYYAQVGNPTACIDGCAPPPNQDESPNGDIGIDAMISVIAHELTEAVTDPESDGDRAWQDATGYENADKCAWTYGSLTKGDAGYYNTKVGDRYYLIQQNWSPESQSCVMTVE